MHDMSKGVIKHGRNLGTHRRTTDRLENSHFRVPEPEPKEFLNSGTHLGTQTKSQQIILVPVPFRNPYQH